MKKLQMYFGNKLKKFNDFDDMFKYVETKFNMYNCGISNCESYLDILNEKLYESQLFSSDIDKTISIVSNKFKIDLYKQQNHTIKFHIVKTKNKNIDIIDNYEKIMDYFKNLGWNFSYVAIDDGAGLPKKEKNINMSDIKNNSYIDVIVYMSALNDIELLNYNGKLYHVTLDYLENKINRLGLVPKSNNKINNHSDRVYMFLEYDKYVIDSFIKTSIIKTYLNLLDKHYNTYAKFNVYEIDLNTVKNNLRMFYDPYFTNNIAVYTLNSIPPYSLSIVDTITINYIDIIKKIN